MITSQSPDADWINWTLDARPSIAVVGISNNPQRPSYQASAYLLEHGFNLIPVNPRYTSVLGRPCHPSLAAVPVPIGVVNLFQASDKVMPFVEQAISLGAALVWMQLGIVNEDAAALARAANLGVIMDRCIKIEHELRQSTAE